MKILVLALFFSLTGCVPVPTFYYSKQPISGVLSFSGHPQAGVTVAYDGSTDENLEESTCKNIISSTTTNESGEFKLAGKQEFFYFMPLLFPVEHSVIHHLCFNDPKLGNAYWTRGATGYPGGSKKTIWVNCALTFPETDCEQTIAP